MKLAAYAMRSEDSEGRRYYEPRHPYRNEYQRDRDRIIHTKAFRRLEKKTQVFAPNYSDHFRNRLTHTIEVSQISRTISQALGLNCDLCEVLALSHDIGHPPFSHEGERVLNQIMKTYGLGFEHNLHALKIVEDFEEKYPAFRGLNLTFEVREGIIKHSRDYTTGENVYMDIDEYRLDELPPLEAQLIDIADEIAYNSADLDDGYVSGLLSVDRMVENMDLFREFWKQVRAEFPDASERLRVGEVIRRIINYLVSRLIESTRDRISANEIRSVADVRSFSKRLIQFDRDSFQLNHEVKSFLKGNLYDHPVLKQALKTVERELSELFEFYYENPEQLPPGHREKADTRGRAGVVCDYIAGMTDFYARKQYSDIHTAPSNTGGIP